MKSLKPTYRVLPNGVQVPSEDNYIWEAYNDSCVYHTHRLAVCLHEEPPKSLNPRWEDDPQNRYPVCQECHDLLHESLNRKEALAYLRGARATNFPDAERKILDQLNSKEGI